MASPKKRERWISPKGVAVWPKLNEPDTKFDAAGTYTARLAYDAGDKNTKAFIAKLEQYQKERFAEAVKDAPKLKKYKMAPVFTEETDEDGEETGRILVNFKMTASGKSKKTGKAWKRKPTIIDARKVTLANPPNIGGGSVLRIGFEPSFAVVASSKLCYVSCRMEIVQIIELVEFGAANADDYGFGEEEGYEADDKALTKPAAEDDDDDSDDDGEEDGDDGDF